MSSIKTQEQGSWPLFSTLPNKMKFSVKDFLSKFEKNRRNQLLCLLSQNKSLLTENFIFWSVLVVID